MHVIPGCFGRVFFRRASVKQHSAVDMLKVYHRTEPLCSINKKSFNKYLKCVMQGEVDLWLLLLLG